MLKQTDQEPASNMRVIHECGCRGDALKPNPKYALMPLKHFVKKFAKIKFVSRRGQNEYMWVEVKEIEGENLKGTLNNDPQLCTHLRDGDPVTLTREQIIDVC